MFARPVRPPAETPVELSMYAVTVDVPSSGSGDGAHRVGKQRLTRTRQHAVAKQPGLVGNADERAH